MATIVSASDYVSTFFRPRVEPDLVALPVGLRFYVSRWRAPSRRSLEMYKPAAKRRWGYYALPVLHDDRLVAKVDATADRKASVLRVAKDRVLETPAIGREHLKDSLIAAPCFVASDSIGNGFVSNLAAGHLKANQLLKLLAKAHSPLPVLEGASLTIRTMGAEQVALIHSSPGSIERVALRR
jgi:DNA glycosylase AlkZ-like